MNPLIQALIEAVTKQATMECKAATAYEVGLHEKALEYKTAATLLAEDSEQAARELNDYIDACCRMTGEGG